MEDWEERTCIFCRKGVVENEWHFIMECPTYEDIHNQFERNPEVDSLNELFEEARILQTMNFLIKIHDKGDAIERILKIRLLFGALGPLDFLVPWTC